MEEVAPITVLVCGSRTWLDPKPVAQRLNALLAESGGDLVVMHGAAAGADSLAGGWAKAHLADGVMNDPHPADWDQHGKRAAGPIRNREMLKDLLSHRDDEGRRIVALAFRIDGKSTGTDDMIGLVKRAGVPGSVIRPVPKK